MGDRGLINGAQLRRGIEGLPVAAFAAKTCKHFHRWLLCTFIGGCCGILSVACRLNCGQSAIQTFESHTWMIAIVCRV